MSDTPDTQPDQRPAHACVTCPPPKNRAWWPAHPGYKTCDDCYTRLRDLLTEINHRFLLLNPAPGGSGEHGGRGAPGFGSRPAASPHVITMTDWRSKSCEVAFDGFQYVWDPLADTVLEQGQYGPPGGAYVAKREVWYGRDGRGHSEQEKPPRSIPSALSSLAGLVAEERDMTAPTSRDVPKLIRWIDGQLDWITRHDLVVDVYEDLRGLAAQLKPVTGDPARRRIGLCPNTIDEGETTRQCSTALYAPQDSDTIRCTACDRKWLRPEWEELGKLLQEETLQRAS